MIENVYTARADGKEEYSVNGRKAPKNVRQIGSFQGSFRVYLEDYVHTFARWMTERDFSGRCLAVLVGEFARSEQERAVYIYGAVMLNEACAEGSIEITTELWTQVYETIKEYFPDGEIVGWYYGGTSFTDEERVKIKQVHLDQFAGSDRILMLYDYLEQEESFYRYENDELSRQAGFYIYYEKNTEMQNYMIDQKQGKVRQERVEDRAVKEMRERLGVDTETKESKDAAGRPEEKSFGGRFIYMTGIVVTAVAVVSGASMIYNQERLNGFEQTLNRIAGLVTGTSDRQDGQEGKEPIEVADGKNENIFNNPRLQETFHNSNPTDMINLKENNVTAIPSVSLTPEISPTPAEQISQEGQNENENLNEEDGKASESEENINTEQKEGEENTEETEPTQAAFHKEEYDVYIVQPGDTLIGICTKRYGDLSNLETIKEINQLNDENMIYAYQELLVP